MAINDTRARYGEVLFLSFFRRTKDIPAHWVVSYWDTGKVTQLFCEFGNPVYFRRL